MIQRNGCFWPSSISQVGNGEGPVSFSLDLDLMTFVQSFVFISTHSDELSRPNPGSSPAPLNQSISESISRDLVDLNPAPKTYCSTISLDTSPDSSLLNQYGWFLTSTVLFQKTTGNPCTIKCMPVCRETGRVGKKWHYMGIAWLVTDCLRVPSFIMCLQNTFHPDTTGGKKNIRTTASCCFCYWVGWLSVLSFTLMLLCWAAGD